MMNLMLLLCAFMGESEDHKAVEAAILDYVEGIYLVQPERIKKSVHPTMRKVGYYHQEGKWAKYDMTFEQLVQLAERWNKDGKIPKDSPKEITIYDIREKTASAKLVAYWGQDYFHLAKLDGKWWIVNVIWQSLPEMQ